MDDMNIVDVIRNIEKWDSWDFKSYPLSRKEAKTIVDFFHLFEEAYKAIKSEEGASDVVD